MSSRTDRRHAGRTGCRGALVVALAIASAWIAGPSPAEASDSSDTIIYGVNGLGLADVVELNLTQRTSTYVGDVARESQAVDQDPVTGRLYYYEWRRTGNEFGYFDPSTGDNVIVRQYSPGPGLDAKRMAFGSDGVLYMMDVNDVLYTIDEVDGDLTSLGPVSGLGGGQWRGTGDMAFSPDGTLYVAVDRSLYAVDIDGLSSTLLYSDMIPVTGVGITIWTGLAFCDGLLYASNAEEYTGRSTIFSIDPATGSEELEFSATSKFNDLSSCPAFEVENVAPVAVGGSVSTPEGVPVGVVLSASDGDGDVLSYRVTGGPSNGSLSGVGSELTYTPDAGFVGSDSFSFVANDGSVDSNVATVSITVTAVDGVPGSPVELSATAGDGEVSLAWVAPGDDGGSAIDDYVVELAPRGGSWVTFADGVGTSTSTVVTGLTNYDEYRFRVAAVNAVGAGENSAPLSATPSDGDDPDETFNYPDGPLSDQVDWMRVDPATLSDLRVVDGHVIGTGDPDGTGAGYTTPVGPQVEVTVDALLGDSYNEVSVVLRMNEPDEIEESYLLQWVTDGDEALQGSVVGPALQIWRIDPGPAFRLLAESSLPDDGERRLTFGAGGSNLYIAEGATVHLSHSDSIYPTGDFFALGQANLSAGGTPSQIDNMRWAALADVNLAPVAVGGSVSTPEGVPVGVVLSASDGDGDVLSYRVTGGPSNGSLSGVGSELTYTPDAGFVGSDSFSFVANDGSVDSNVATVSITVTGDVDELITWAPSRTGAMRTVNLTRGTSSSAPGLSFGTHAMDRDPATGLLYYFEWNTTGDQFAVWDPSTGSSTAIRTYAPAPGIFVTQMGFAPDGTLYAIDAAAQLHTIDPANGDITTLGPISGMTNGQYGQMGDLAFAPDGTGYVASYGELYRLDIATRTASLLHGAMFGTAPQMWLGLAYCDGVLYGSDVNSSNRSSIFSIDPITGGRTLVHALATFVTDLTGCATS